MMRHVLLIAVAVLVAAPAGALQSDSVPVDELLAASAEYGDQRITIEGELVGDYGFRSDGWMWTQLNDDPYARKALVEGGERSGANVGVAIRMPDALATGLDPVGGYRLRGPLVRVSGIWKHHDPARGGESYLDVATIEVLEPGRRIEEGPDWLVFGIGAALIAAALVMWRRRPAS